MDAAVLAPRASAAGSAAASGGGVELPLRLCLPSSRNLLLFSNLASASLVKYFCLVLELASLFLGRTALVIDYASCGANTLKLNATLISFM
jgi:hypothetical protein